MRKLSGISEDKTARDRAVNEYLAACLRSAQTHIILMAIFPRAASPNDPLRAPIERTNALLAQRFGNDPAVTYLDIGKQLLSPDGSLSPEIMPDGTHPRDRGYQIWADALKKAGVKP
ncbi:MAG: hypothetical protein WAM79_20210 [Candidatus Sulfotelmatobacter sp.]